MKRALFALTLAIALLLAGCGEVSTTNGGDSTGSAKQEESAKEKVIFLFAPSAGTKQRRKRWDPPVASLRESEPAHTEALRNQPGLPDDRDTVSAGSGKFRDRDSVPVPARL